MWKWIWNNLSNIDSLINIIKVILGGFFCICGFIWGVLQLKLKNNQYKYLNLIVDRQTKQSMKYYVNTRAQTVDPCSEEFTYTRVRLLPLFIKQIFKNSETQYYIILADSGMGKTTFLLKLFFKYYKKIFKKYSIVLIPLSLEGSFKRINEIKNKPETILLLDGFDEDAHAMMDYVGRLKQLCNETELFYKVIITCRTQFFPDRDSEPRYTGKIKFGVGKKSVEFEKYYISPFTEEEIKVYLKKKYNFILGWNKIKRSQRLIYNCPQLMIRPMLLSYIDDLILDKTQKYDYTYEIYKQLVDKWIERESVENIILYEFSEKLAEYMYMNRRFYVEGNEIEKLCIKYGIKIKDIEAKSRSLLNRNANGDYKFAHKSILEFFLAKMTYEKMKIDKDMPLDNFFGYDMVKLFLKEMSYIELNERMQSNCKMLYDFPFIYLNLHDYDFSGMKIINCVFEGCDLSKTNFTNTTFERVKFNNINLREANLQNVNLREADLQGTDIDNANLKWADLSNTILRKVNFNNADMRNADLSNADLSDANLSGANLSNVILRGADLRHVYLKNTYLSNADLSYVDLRFTILIGEDLKETDLRGSLLDGYQISCLNKEKHKDINSTRIYIEETDEVVSYKEYVTCERNFE